MLIPAWNILNTKSPLYKMAGRAMSSTELDYGILGDGQANLLSLTKEEDYTSSSGDSNTQGVPAGAKKPTQTTNDVRPLGHQSIQSTNSTSRTGTMRNRTTPGRAKVAMEKHTKAVKAVYDINDEDNSDQGSESPDLRSSTIHCIPQLASAQRVPSYTHNMDLPDPCVPNAIGAIHVMDTQEQTAVHMQLFDVTTANAIQQLSQ